MRTSRLCLRLGLAIVCLPLVAELPSTPPPSKLCRVRFPGPAFLTAASQHGLSAESSWPCATIRLDANQFFAPPNVGCVVAFNDSTWLQQGAHFAALSGVGAFTATRMAQGLQVSIDASGGFRLTDITIVLKDGDCKKASLGSVLQ